MWRSHLFVLKFNGVCEKHGADVAGFGSRNGDDRGLGQLVENPGYFEARLRCGEEQGWRHRRQRLRLHLHVAGTSAGHQLLRLHWFRSRSYLRSIRDIYGNIVYHFTRICVCVSIRYNWREREREGRRRNLIWFCSWRCPLPSGERLSNLVNSDHF